MSRPTEFAWCETHGEVVRVYPDGGVSCPYDLIVEARTEHQLAPAPSSGRPNDADMRAWLCARAD